MNYYWNRNDEVDDEAEPEIVSRYTYCSNNSPEYPFISRNNLFRDEQTAQLFCQMWNAHWSALASIDTVPQQLSRNEYEAVCIERGYTPLSDSNVDSYNIRYGEFTPWLNGNKIAGYTPSHCVEMALARRRMRAIDAERAEASKRQPERPEPELVRCSCGHYVEQHEVMSASLGSSCQDCYDRMSA